MAEKASDNNGDTPSAAFLVYGELETADKDVIVRLIGRLGAKAKFADLDEFSSVMQRTTKLMSYDEANHRVDIIKDVFHFGNITDPNQYVAREHIENFNDIYPGELPKGFVGRTFNAMVDGIEKRQDGWQSDSRVNGTWRWREVKPVTGIELLTREEANFDPYGQELSTLGRNNLCASFVIRAGSIVAAAEQFADVARKRTQTELGIILLANQLSSQFTTDET